MTDKKNRKSLQSLARRAEKQDMPGTLHQGILLLFQDDPWLAFDLLGLARPSDGIPIDRRGEIERQGADPMDVIQGYPDLVLVHRDAVEARRGIVITVEAQKGFDADKRWSIPAYQSHLAKEHELDTWSVVVSLDRRMSAALRIWATGGPPRVDVLLIDVDTVAQLPWLAEPARRPLATVLVGGLHGYAGDLGSSGPSKSAGSSSTSRAQRGSTLARTYPRCSDGPDGPCWWRASSNCSSERTRATRAQQ